VSTFSKTIQTPPNVSTERLLQAPLLMRREQLQADFRGKDAVEEEEVDMEDGPQDGDHQSEAGEDHPEPKPKTKKTPGAKAAAKSKAKAKSQGEKPRRKPNPLPKQRAKRLPRSPR
jgi:pyruvate/2-oxoglutarate dehydrogenase complex dihydrolipoamide acyltransferase (E2) component